MIIPSEDIHHVFYYKKKWLVGYRQAILDLYFKLNDSYLIPEFSVQYEATNNLYLRFLT